MIKEQFANYGWTLVWENESPTSEFGEQTISVDLSKFDEIAVVSCTATTVDTQTTTFSIIGGGATDIWAISSITAKTVFYVSEREFTPTSTGIAFTTTLRKSTTATSAGTTANNFIIPIYIYAR